jgi:ketosteroid isomerase-like protein
MLPIKEMIQNFYDSAHIKNDAWQNNLAWDITFANGDGSTQSEGKDAFVKLFERALRGMKSIQVKSIVAEGDVACAIVHYEYINPKGETLHQNIAEMWYITGGKLSSLTIYFDLTAFRNFMGR